MLRKWWALIAWAAVAIWPVAQAQRGIEDTTPESVISPRKYGVVIGVNRYSDPGIGSLKCAVADATALYHVLTTAPYGFLPEHLALLTDDMPEERKPTRVNVLKFINNFINVAGPEDTILVYFAGHGTAQNGALYLLPADASVTMLDDTAVAYARIRELLEGAQAKRKVVLLDACHSGAGRSLNRMTEDTSRQLEEASQGTVILASCGPDEVSHEMPESGHGAFTYYLLRGLRGEADANGDGLLGAQEVSAYTWDRTRVWAVNAGFQQNPWNRSFVSGDIILARVPDRASESRDTSDKKKGSPEDSTPSSVAALGVPGALYTLDLERYEEGDYPEGFGGLVVARDPRAECKVFMPPRAGTYSFDVDVPFPNDFSLTMKLTGNTGNSSNYGIQVSLIQADGHTEVFGIYPHPVGGGRLSVSLPDGVSQSRSMKCCNNLFEWRLERIGDACKVYVNGEFLSSGHLTGMREFRGLRVQLTEFKGDRTKSIEDKSRIAHIALNAANTVSPAATRSGGGTSDFNSSWEGYLYELDLSSYSEGDYPGQFGGLVVYPDPISQKNVLMPPRSGEYLFRISEKLPVNFAVSMDIAGNTGNSDKYGILFFLLDDQKQSHVFGIYPHPVGSLVISFPDGTNVRSEGRFCDRMFNVRFLRSGDVCKAYVNDRLFASGALPGKFRFNGFGLRLAEGEHWGNEAGGPVGDRCRLGHLAIRAVPPYVSDEAATDNTDQSTRSTLRPNENKRRESRTFRPNR